MLAAARRIVYDSAEEDTMMMTATRGRPRRTRAEAAGELKRATMIGARLLRLHITTGLEWRAIAARLGVTVQAVRDWRRGICPTENNRAALRRAFPGDFRGI